MQTGEPRMKTGPSAAVGNDLVQQLHNDPTPAAIFDQETLRCLAVNDAALRLYGYTREEFLGLSLSDTRHPDEDGDQLLPPGAAAYPRHGGMRRHIRSSGDVFRGEVIVQDVVFASRPARLVLTLDRTERARTRTALRERERLFSALVENAPDVIARIDRELRHVYVNPAVATATGIAPEALIGKTSPQLGVPLELCVRWAAGVRRVFATGREQDIEITYSTDAGLRHYESRMVPERGSDGEIETVLAIARDITNRKQSELALRASEARLRRSQQEFETLADAIPEVIACFDRELRYAYANAAIERATGLSRAVLIGRSNVDAGIPAELAESWDGCLKRVFDTGKPESLEYEHSALDEPRRYDARYIPLMSGEGVVESVLCVAHDVTDRKRSEDERFATMARQRDAFLREVHHRVKNNLQGVVGLLRQNANSRAALAPFLEKAISQLQAMATVHDLQGRQLRESVMLNEMATEIGKSVERTTGVKVSYEIKGREGPVPELRETEAVAVALVLNEIVMNAAKHGGTSVQTNAVTITGRISPQRAEIAVLNRGTLPAGFDFGSGSGLGTGLELVKALMPRDGASITYVGNDGYVRAVLELSPPVIARAADKIKEIRNDWDRRDRPYSDRRR